MSAPQETQREALVIEYPPELPVSERREDIAAAIAAHQVVIIAGETGSGKTTQLPKICLQLGRGCAGQIGHTQPRRLAARTVAQRIAQELGQELGETVGFQVRFTDVASADTRVKLMTDGILLAEIQRDRDLLRYDTIIIDEAHERSLNIDFLLGYLTQLLPRRPDLKVIITSATIDVDAFSQHFSQAPVIEVSGRTYPVETRYLEPDNEGGDIPSRVADAMESIAAREYGAPGDTLVFLSGEAEIRETAKVLRLRDIRGLDILPLYARLSQAEQNRVFQRSGRAGQRVVLATNVAETSLTVPGIRYVIDPGYARMSRYSYRTKVQRLPIEAVSRASADQRKGRCGRVAEGVCLRLYSEQDFDSRPEYTEPEIQRTSLASVILQMLRLGLGEVARFPFINPPDPRLVRDGYKLLQELGAVDGDGRLTRTGRQMSGFPVDPRFARMLLASVERDCLREMLVICSALTVQDPRDRPQEKRQAADEKHRRFEHERSDFLAWINLWDYYEEQRQQLSQNRLRKLCQKEYLAFMRMREWRDIHFQLTVACRRAGLRANTEPAEYEQVHRALLAGLLGNMASLHEGHDYLGSRNRKLRIFPGSSQFRKKPRWLLAAEIVETSQVYARCVAAIEPAWALDINPALLKYQYSEPHWQARSGRVMAQRRTTLYGLVLVERERVHYGPVDPVRAREILIRAALVEGRLRQKPAFLRHNLKLVEDLQHLESRLRRRDIVVDDEAIYAFYEERLPADITTLGRLKGWLKKDAAREASLRLAREQLMLRSLDEDLGNQFPDKLCWKDLELPLSYHFEPGHDADGVSVTVPVALLNRMPRHLGEWLVPGLLRDKCIQLLKDLPKSVRKSLVPVPDHVDRALADMPAVDEPLTRQLARRLQQSAGVRIDESQWREAALDPWYLMNYRVVDADGSLKEQGRDLLQLVERYQEDTRASLVLGDADSPACTGLTRWTIGDLPLSWRSEQAGVEIESWPALVDHGDSVSVELLDYRAPAAIAHRKGLLKLLRLHSSQSVRQLKKQLLRGNEFNLVIAGSAQERGVLLEDLVDACYVRAMLPQELDQLPRSESAFLRCLEHGRGDLMGTGLEYETLLSTALATLADIRQLLAVPGSADSKEARADIELQLAALFKPGFLRDTPFQWIRHYPRYLKAVHLRLQRFSGQVQKDSAHRQQLQELEGPLHEYLLRDADALLLNDDLLKYRWMLEEFRVSLFAQSLGTSLPVSAKRIQEQWQRVEKA